MNRNKQAKQEYECSMGPELRFNICVDIKSLESNRCYSVALIQKLHHSAVLQNNILLREYHVGLLLYSISHTCPQTFLLHVK